VYIKLWSITFHSHLSSKACFGHQFDWPSHSTSTVKSAETEQPNLTFGHQNLKLKNFFFHQKNKIKNTCSNISLTSIHD